MSRFKTFQVNKETGQSMVLPEAAFSRINISLFFLDWDVILSQQNYCKAQDLFK